MNTSTGTASRSIGGHTGKRYRIIHGDQLNVFELDADGSPAFCVFLPRGNLPVADAMLAQKTALELFEPEALGIANRSRLADLRYPEREFSPAGAAAP